MQQVSHNSCSQHRCLQSVGTGLLCLFLPIMLCCSAHKIYLSCSKLCLRIRNVLSLFSLFMYIQVCMNKLLLITQFRKTVLLGCLYKWQKTQLPGIFSKTMTVQLEYINHLSKTLPISLALCLILSVTYYTQNCAGIIGWSLLCLICIPSALWLPCWLVLQIGIK